MHFLLRDVTCDQILNMNLRVDVLNYIFILPSIPGEYSIFSQLVLCAALDLKILFSSIYSIQNFHTVLGLTKLNSNRAHFHSEPRQWRDFLFRHTRISSHWFFSDIHRRKVCISFKSSWNLDPFLKHSLNSPSCSLSNTFCQWKLSKYLHHFYIVVVMTKWFAMTEKKFHCLDMNCSSKAR